MKQIVDNKLNRSFTNDHNESFLWPYVQINY